MNLCEALETLDARAAAGDVLDLMGRLFPICRSITGAGVRRTLAEVGARLPLQVREVPTGSPALDWSIPPEWNIRAGWIKDPGGRIVVDFADHNLHVLNYSVPVRAKLSLAELQAHLHSIPEHPDWIPYKTSYYREAWGFCLADRQRKALVPGEYEVCIDSTLAPGSLTYGECVLPGSVPEEILISTHVCHPSLANDNLSGIATATRLAILLQGLERRHTFRFLFIPGTIGALAWLQANPDAAARVKHGLVLTGLGNDGPIVYKRSRRGDAEVDRAAAHVLKHAEPPGGRLIDFFPYGYDERQYCSPGFDLPVGRVTRTPHGEYPEYHTSADNLDFVRIGNLADSLSGIARILAVLEGDRRYLNLSPKGEPQLGKRGLYAATGGRGSSGDDAMDLLWVLNQSDGGHSLLDIAERAGRPFEAIRKAAERLGSAGLLADVVY